MRVLAFTGLPGSGKSVAVEAARARGVPVVRMGDFVLEEVRRRGLAATEEHIGPVATGMRREHGDDIWAVRTVEALRSGRVKGVDRRTPLVAIDGVRSGAEITRFKRELGDDFTLIAIDTPEEVRHARLIVRGRDDDATHHAVARQRDERERSWGVEAAMRSADHIVHNDRDLASFRRDVEALLGSLLAAS